MLMEHGATTLASGPMLAACSLACLQRLQDSESVETIAGESGAPALSAPLHLPGLSSVVASEAIIIDYSCPACCRQRAELCWQADIGTRLLLGPACTPGVSVGTFLGSCHPCYTRTMSELMQVNVGDPRFQGLFTSQDFALDPTDPQFGKAPGAAAILAEAARRKASAPQGEPSAGPLWLAWAQESV